MEFLNATYTNTSCFKTVTPAQPANFMFALDSVHGPGTPLLSIYLLPLLIFSSVRESLILTIKYRMLREGETIQFTTFSFISDAFFKRWNP